MKILATILIIAALLWCVVPRSSADLNAWNDGTNSIVNVGRLNLNGTGSSTWVLNVTSNGVSMGGWTNNGQFLISDGSVANPGLAFASDNDGAGTGFYRPAANRIGVAIDGALLGQFQNVSGLEFRIVSAGFLGWNGDLWVSRENAGVLQLGVDAASVVNQVLKAHDATGTDHNGAILSMKGGQSTGSGVPGDLIYQTSLYTNSSGSTANAYTTRGQIVGRPCALTNATPTSFQRFTMATNTQAGIKLFCTVKATDAAFARQSISSDVRVDAVNVNGTITATVSETDNTLAASTGTLTIAYTVVDEGSNVLAIRANANTSLTATPSIKWVIQSINSDGAITVTPVQL